MRFASFATLALARRFFFGERSCRQIPRAGGARLGLGRNGAGCEYSACAAPRRRGAHYELTPTGACASREGGRSNFRTLQLSGAVPVA
jgi:hypothetical protein